MFCFYSADPAANHNACAPRGESCSTPSPRSMEGCGHFMTVEERLGGLELKFQKFLEVKIQTIDMAENIYQESQGLWHELKGEVSAEAQAQRAAKVRASMFSWLNLAYSVSL